MISIFGKFLYRMYVRVCKRVLGMGEGGERGRGGRAIQSMIKRVGEKKLYHVCAFVSP